MITVNEYMVRSLLGPLGGTSDRDDSECFQLSNVDGNSELQVKEIIKKYILPFYFSASEKYKMATKQSLSYFLTTNKMDYGYHYDSYLIAFDHPTDPRDFFLWVWETLFLEEEYHIENISAYCEVEDINEPYNYL
jgi:hypothetical protein